MGRRDRIGQDGMGIRKKVGLDGKLQDNMWNLDYGALIKRRMTYGMTKRIENNMV